MKSPLIRCKSEMDRMTRRGGKKASERRSGIGKDERQPVMAQLSAR